MRCGPARYGLITHVVILVLKYGQAEKAYKPSGTAETAALSTTVAAFGGSRFAGLFLQRDV